MFPARTAIFRDFTVFSCFLVLFTAFEDSGLGQQGTRGPAPEAYSGQPRGVKAKGPAARVATAAARTGTFLPASAFPAGTAGENSAANLTARLTASMPAGLMKAGGYSLSGLPLHAHKSGTTATPFARGARPSGHSVKPRTQENNHSVDNPADPYIVNQAAALGKDPNQIFAFVRDQIAFDVYSGSLRGARGTLWSKAGNSVDKSSLLVALLNASGFNAEYVQGTLTAPQQQQLIRSSFHVPLNVIGCPSPAAQIADPANDPTLLQEASDHWWVIYGAAGATPSINLDASFAGSTAGQTFGSNGQTQAVLPFSERMQVTFRMDVEQYSAASAALAQAGFSTTEVLNQNFDSAELVGVPVTFGNQVTGSSLSAVTIASTTYTYTPYLRFGNDATDLAGDTILQGQAYQENFTNFPLGSSFVTGIFLFMDITDQFGNRTTYERDMLDRLGYAVRMNGTAGAAAPSGQNPAVTEEDLYTVAATPGFVDPNFVASYQATANALTAQSQVIQTQLAGVNEAAPSPADLQTEAAAITNLKDSIVTQGRIMAYADQTASDMGVQRFGPAYDVKAYYTLSRLTIFSNRVNQNADGSIGSMNTALDLRSNGIQAIAPPGQVTTAPFDFQVFRGLLENVIEAETVATLSAGGDATKITNTAVVLNAAIGAGIPIAALTPSQSAQVNTFAIPGDAQARIQAALAAGDYVLVPQSEPLVNGVARIGWFELNPSTGEAVGVLVDGTHGGQGPEEEGGNYGKTGLYISIARNQMVTFIKTNSYVVGFGLGVFVGEIAKAVAGPLFSTALTFLFGFLSTFVAQAQALQGLAKESFSRFVVGFILGFSKDLGPGVVTPDPPVPGILEPWLAATPVAGAGLGLSLAANKTFSVLEGNAELPLVAQLSITNNETGQDTFTLSPTTSVAGLAIEQSTPSVALGANQTGSETVCLVPSGGGLPAPGTQETLTVTGTSTSNPAVSSTSQLTFTVPSIPGLTLTSGTQNFAVTPGQSVMAALQITGAGNVSTTAPLAASVDPNLTLSGLTSPVTAAVGQVSTQNLTITPASTAPLNVPLPVTIVASYGDPTIPTTVAITFTIVVEAAQALPIANAAAPASAAGRTDIANTLSGLSGAVSAIVAACNARTLAALQDYAAQLSQELQGSATYLSSSIFDSAAGGFSGELNQEDCTSYTTGLTDLTTVVNNVSTLLAGPGAFPFQFAITPAAVTAAPNTTNLVKIELQNRSLVTQTYNLALSGVPAGVTGTLNVASVTLGPGASVPAGAATDPTVTIAETGGALEAFGFTVTATPVAAVAGAQTETGVVSLRPDVLEVQDVKAAPGFATAGAVVDVTADVANTVNEPTPVLATLTITDASNQQIATVGPQAATLTVASILASIDFGNVTIPATAAAGNATLAVTLTDVNGKALTGGTGSGFLLIGSPVTATLSVNPRTVPTGDTTLLNSLTVVPTAANGNGLQLLGSLATNSPAVEVTLNGNTAYVCDQNELSVMDVSNPAAPKLLNTALSDFIKNAANIHCNVEQGDLVIFSDTNSTTLGNNPGFLVFGLTNPRTPSLLNAVPFTKRFVGEPIIYLNKTAFLYTNAVLTSFGSPFDQHGDIIAVDLTDVTNPKIIGTLSQGGDATYGGPNEIYGTALYNPNILFAGSTTLSGGNFTNGTGVFDVIDISDPTKMSLTTQLATPDVTYLFRPVIQGNFALALGNTTGNPGKTFLEIFDIADPNNPSIISSTPTNTSCCSGGGVAVLGPNQFLFAGTTDANNKPLLLEVDTTNTAQPLITPLSVPDSINGMTLQSNLLYAASGAAGLTIYQIPANQLDSSITGYTASVQAANNAVIAYDPASFNVAPTSITKGTGFDTIRWANPGVRTLEWNSKVTGFVPGQTGVVDQGGTVTFQSTLGNGTVDLPQVSIDAQNIIGMTPAAQSFTGPFPAGVTPYNVIVRNPTNAAVTYNLALSGVPPGWLHTENIFGVPPFPATVTVPAQSSVTVPLLLDPLDSDPTETVLFSVSASASGLFGSVQGSAVYTNANPLPPDSTPGTGPVSRVVVDNAVVTMTPTTATAGPGTMAAFLLSITNVGPTTSSFQAFFNLNGSPSFFVGAQFSNQFPTIPPGATATLTMILTVPAGAAPGSYPFTVQVSGNNSSQLASVNGTLNIVANGLTLAFPSSGFATQGSTVALTVTNSGSVADTFNLALTGPAASGSTLAAPSVTLAAGASQAVNVSIGNLAGLAQGNVTLTATGASQANPAVTTSVSTTVFVTPAYSLTAAFQPATQNPKGVGAVVFPLAIQNTGNAQDSYVVAITGTTGGLTASLTGFDGNPTQQVAGVILPAEGGGQLFLSATGAGGKPGTATVQVSSKTQTGVSATATATLGAGGQVTPLVPIAAAGAAKTVPLHRLALLDASGSTDPNTPPQALTYSWALTGAPAGSALQTASIAQANASLAAFRPDVAGPYTFTVTVSNAEGSSTASVTDTAAIQPPVAVTGKMVNVPGGGIAILTGRDSYDPSGLPLTFAWQVTSAPAGSKVTTAALQNAQTPKPYFTPDVAGQYALELVVNNGTLASAPAAASVAAYAAGAPPDANAGPAVFAAIGERVTLNGGASADGNSPPRILSYQWSFVSTAPGSALVASSIAGSATAAPAIVPDVVGDYVLSLKVTNSAGASTDTTTVHVVNGNIPPNALAGADQYALPGQTVNLSAQGSVDPDNGPANLAYLWWQDGLPAGSAAKLVNPLTAAPALTPDISGYFVERVEATDSLASGFANVLVTAAKLCDADANGVVNQNDIDLIKAAIGQSALPNDPRDFTGDGMITAADAVGCAGKISATTPALNVAPATLSFQGMAGGAASSQNLTVSVNNGGGPVGFTVVSNQGWLTAQPAAGNTGTAAVIAISANPANLKANTYNGVITITASGVSNSPLQVAVTFTVAPAAPPVTPKLVANPAVLDFEYTPGEADPARQLVALNGSDGGTQSVLVSAAASWLSATLPGNTVPGSLQVSANPAGLAPGYYGGAIAVSGGTYSNVPLTIQVTLHVAQPPTVFTAPAPVAFVAAQGSTAIQTQQVSIASNEIANFTLSAASSGWLSVAQKGGTTPESVTFIADPTGLPAGNYAGTVTVTPQVSTVAPVAVNVTLNITQTAVTPAITAVVNSASFATGPLAPGSLFTVFGAGFTSNAPATANTVPLPLTLSGLSMTVNGVAVPFLYAQGNQINAQMPFEAPVGTASLVLSLDGSPLAPVAVQVAETAPGLFLLDGKHGAIENLDHSINSDSNPVPSGGYISAFITGQGAVTPGLGTNVPASGNPLDLTAAATTATVGGQAAALLYSGLAPGFIGLAQVNLQVPSLPAGDYPVVITIGGAASNAGVVSVGPAQ